MANLESNMEPTAAPAKSGALDKAASLARDVVSRFSSNDANISQATGKKSVFARYRGIFAFVLLPLLLVSAYYLFWVSERYVSTSQFIVKENGAEQNVNSTLGILMPGVSGDSQDAYLVVNYIQSLDMALYLNESLGLFEYYKNHDYDYFSRLGSSASQEDYLQYYRSHIGVGYDELTGIVSIQAQAFEPEFARLIVETITRKSEDFVNAISQQLAEKQVNFVRKEMELAKSKLRESKQQVLIFQNQNEVISPESLTQGISAIIQGLETRLADQRAKLSAAKTYLNADSSQVVSINTEIEALQNQIESEKLRLVGAKGEVGGDRLNSLSADFQNLQLNLQFAMDAYQASLKALETARMEASSRLKHLIVVSEPSLAEEAEYPRKLYNLVSLAVVLLLLYGIFRMLVVSIRDHRI